MKKSTLFIVFFTCIFSSKAQTQSADLDYNNTRIKILNGGDFFWDLALARYQVPKITDQGNRTASTISVGAIWLGAQDSDDNVYLSAMTYRQRGQDFWPGPVSTDKFATRDKYDKIWKVDQYDIDDHKNNPINSAVSEMGWPGNGDTTKGEPFQLAPYVDVNQNNIYDPANGDYPEIIGDVATYNIFSDQGNHTESGGSPLMVDVHQMFYQVPSIELQHVNFARFTIVNRSGRDYKNFKFGVYIDFDIGNFSDDFVGCDTTRNLIYGYNGDDYDESSLGYGLNPPSQNMMFLNAPMTAALTYDNSMNAINGNPINSDDFYSYLSGKFKDGSLATHKDGYKTKFHYSGNPYSNTGWTEESSGNTPGDRRMLAVSESSLGAEETKCFDIAFVYAREPFGGATGSVPVLLLKSDSIQVLYNQTGLKNTCLIGNNETHTSSIWALSTTVNTIKVYPNPSTGIFNMPDIKLTKESAIVDLSGKTIATIKPNQKQIDLSHLESGIYFLKTEFGSARLVKL